MSRQFSSLTPKQALRVAILIEDRNTEVYRRMGEMFLEFSLDSPNVASSFFQMAGIESDHAQILSARYQERFGPLDGEISEEDISDLIEVPRLTINDLIRVLDSKQPADARAVAFEIATEAEKTALEYYQRLVARTADPELLSLYKEFVCLEQEHNAWVDKELAKSRAAKAKNPDSSPLEGPDTPGDLEFAAN